MRSPNRTAVGQAGERIVERIVNELDLVRPKSCDRVAHLAGQAQVVDERQNQAGEHGRDDAQTRDHVEQAEMPGLSALERRREDGDGQGEVGERHLPRGGPVNLVASPLWSACAARRGRGR